MPQYYKPTAEMIEVKEIVSTVESFKDQWVKRPCYEAQVAYAFNEGKKAGAMEKALDYETAKEKRIHEGKKALNDAIEHLKLAIENYPQ